MSTPRMLFPPSSLKSLLPIAVAALVLGAAAPAMAEDATFTSAPDVTFDKDRSLLSAVAVGDFNSDGRQDVAITDFSRDRVYVRQGNGDGTFSGSYELTGLSRPQDVATGDFNSDGIEDLALAAGTSPTNAVAVLRGAGNGTFTRVAAFPLFGQGFANSIAIGDYNGDGREDLAAASFGYVTVRLADANGAFGGGTERSFPGLFPGALVSGDFDGNGNEDLAVGLSGSPNQLGVLTGKGDGSFDPVKTTSLPNSSDRLAVADFNADGREDVAAAISLEDRVSVRLGNGDGRFSDDAPDVAVGDRPGAVAVGDFDSDGREDFVVTNLDSDTMSVRLGNGDGTFRNGGELPVGDFPYSVAAGDFNADGKEDIANTNYMGGTASVRLGSGTSPLAGNLLVNGGFEQGLGARLPTQSPSIPGWTTTGGSTFVRYGASPHLGFPTWLDAPRFGTGGLNFLWGGDSTGLNGITTAGQTADVAGSAEAIDGGRATANLSAYLGGAQAYPDHMSAMAEFLTADGTSAGALRIGPVTREDRHNVTTLLSRAGSAPVPAGTRRIRVTLTSTDTDTVSSAIADNVKLTLDTSPAGGSGTSDDPARQEFGPDTNVTVRLATRRVGAKGPVPVRLANANAFGVKGTLSGRTATVTSTGRKTAKLPTKRFTVGATSRSTVRLALSKALRRELARRRKLTLRLSAVVEDPAGNRRTVRNRVVLRLKARRAKS